MDRLRNEVARRRGSPAEAAAQKHRVDHDLLGFQSRDFRRVLLVHGLELRAGPDLAAVGDEPHRTVHGFHRRVREVGHLVVGFDRLCGRPRRRFDITCGRGPDARRCGQRPELLAHAVGVQLRPRPEVPVDLQRVAPEPCRPEVFGDDRDA